MPKQKRFENMRCMYRLLVALAILAAIAWQLRFLYHAIPGFRPWNFLSFFTIQTNIIGAVALLWAALAKKHSAVRDVFRGAATLYLATTGVVFALLLANTPEAVDTTIPWVNAVLHELAPLLIVIDWLWDLPQSRLTVRQVVWWLAYPVAWLGYTLVRGVVVDWYPYSFVDPGHDGGYGRVGLYVLGITLFVVLAAAGLAFATNGRIAATKKMHA
ncbi:MAG TPA: Pr6Pr family membrane protein [Candidatus Saccharimonadales bacterium]|nr:Pr6Pr family membrane protein [Candidatus Saccharimonadales bacterium]